MTREEYIATLQDLFSKDANRIREANRKLYAVAVDSADGTTEQDLALAEAAVQS